MGETMMADGAAVANASWQLEDFIDSLVVELDKTRETLAVKAINKPLSYTVREMALDLNVFPSYDGDQISFTNAQPGQQGASKVTIQLGTITDQQVRATTNVPGKGDVRIAETGVDKTTQKKLRRLGVTSDADLKKIEQKNVDLKEVSDDSIDYSQLANQIATSRRAKTPPQVRSASLSIEPDNTPVLVVSGKNLAIDPRFPPVAVINDKLADVLSSNESEIRLRLERQHNFQRANDVVLTVDPFAVVRFQVKAKSP
jgi:hypothetical protein